VKLAHLADLHLGFRQCERQTPRGGNQREADVAEAFRRAVDDLIDQRLGAGTSARPTSPKRSGARWTTSSTSGPS